MAGDEGDTDHAARLYAAIKEHHDQKADDRCWMDDDKLYEAAGLPKVDRRVGNMDEMLRNCRRFILNRCEAGGWITYAEMERRLEETRRIAERASENADMYKRRLEDVYVKDSVKTTEINVLTKACRVQERRIARLDGYLRVATGRIGILLGRMKACDALGHGDGGPRHPVSVGEAPDWIKEQDAVLEEKPDKA